MNLPQNMNEDIAQPQQKKRCIVFGITRNLGFALGAFLIGFFRHNPEYDGHVIVFHDGVSDADRAAILKIHQDVSFRTFDSSMILGRFSETGPIRDAIEATVSRYSAMYFAKFEMFDCLADHDQCVWFDVDMLVEGNMSGLWDFEDLAWRKATTRTANKHADLRRVYAESLDLSLAPRPNAGVICASRTMRLHHGVDARLLYEMFADVVSRKKIVTGDEMVLMLMAARCGVKVRLLDRAFNCPSGSPHVDDARVIHAIGTSKFWNDATLMNLFPEWRRNYLKWLSLGGSEYGGDVDTSVCLPGRHNAIRKARAERAISILYDQIRDEVPAAFLLALPLAPQYLGFRVRHQGDLVTVRAVFLDKPSDMPKKTRYRLRFEVHLAPAIAPENRRLLMEAIARALKGKGKSGPGVTMDGNVVSTSSDLPRLIRLLERLAPVLEARKDLLAA